jgi:hypothetical protein
MLLLFADWPYFFSPASQDKFPLDLAMHIFPLLSSVGGLLVLRPLLVPPSGWGLRRRPAKKLQWMQWPPTTAC